MIKCVYLVACWACWAVLGIGQASAATATLYPSLPDPVLESGGGGLTAEEKIATLDENFKQLFQEAYASYIKGKYQQAAVDLLQFLQYIS